ncbi:MULTISPECIES: FUSC family protein [Luteibacter]|uniref:FUSC family protein n=1 Tax=Luteibacter TaxID=242605 RepID=UPI00068AC749|nr:MULTISPECIES: FUSC family protein [unclassified Luteibacter]
MAAPTRFEWLYSGKAFFAGMLAFYLALFLQLPNPYWSFATVYIVSHPLSGATRSKGVYRAIGTAIGAAVALLLVSALAESPMLLVFALGTWMGVSLYLSLGNNTPSAYAFLLASYTAPLIAIPAILAPGSIFDIAVARTEEILLGIVCASVVSTVLFPSRVSPLFHARVASLLKDAGDWTGQRLRHLDRSAPPPLRLRLLNDVLALDALITHLSYDSTRDGQAEEARQIRMRMTLLLPQVASLSDALVALDGRADTRDGGLQDVLDATIAWMHEGTTASITTGDVLRTRCGALRLTTAMTTPGAHALHRHATERLTDVIDLWRDVLLLHTAFTEHRPQPTPLIYRAHTLDHRARHDDLRARLLAAASPAMAVIATGWLWLLTDWPGGAGGVVLVAIATAFFAASDDPAPQVRRFLVWQAISVVTAGTYLFLVLPRITTFMGVVAAMAPFFLVLGAFTGRPSMTTGIVLVTSQTVSAIALQNNAAVGFEDFANSATGMMLGLGFALAWTLVTRPLGGDSAAHRLGLANARDLALLAQPASAPKQVARATRVLDRTMQWLPRIALATGESLVRMDAVRDMRLCLALLDLQRIARGAATDIDDVLARSRAWLLDCVARRTRIDPPDALLTLIDAAAMHRGDGDGQLATLLIAYRLALSEPVSPLRISPALP